MKKILSAIDRNPLFSAKENAVNFLPENRPVSKLPPKQRSIRLRSFHVCSTQENAIFPLSLLNGVTLYFPLAVLLQ